MSGSLTGLDPEALALFSAAGTVAMGIIHFLAKGREEDQQRRLGNVEEAVKKIHEIEVGQVRMCGDIALVQKSHDTLHDDVEGIVKTMATKTDIANLEKINQMILAEVRGGRRASYDPSMFPKSDNK